MSQRIGIAGFMHESCTFNPMKTDRTAFLQQSYTAGEALVREWKTSHHEVGGFFQTLDELGCEAVPLVMAWATPSGPVTDDIYEEIVEKIIQAIKSADLDGLLLALHGAMVVESHLDADGETLSRIRQAVGPNLPIAVTLDFHGNISERVIQCSNAAIAYQTNPHVDQFECGKKAASLLVRHLRGEIKLHQAIANPPLIVNIMKQTTALDPLASHLRQARELENDPSIHSVSLLAGFPYADVPQMGPSVIVIAEEPERAQTEATALGAVLWANRESFHADLPNAKTAVNLALQSKDTPVVLVDTGDNVGGGSAANSTIILRELLQQNATDSVVCLFAPEAVQRCLNAGVGSEVTFTVGEEPIEVKGKVRLIHDGDYIEPEIRHGAKRENHMGLTALVEMEGRNLLVLNSLRHPPFSLRQLTCLGIYPSEMRILVVKAAIAYKAAYGPIAGQIIEVATPGLTAVDPHLFDYQHIRRPLYPLE